mmetsp:Transcript_4110/g.9795  ORF Transcript_4110/g.9795 Transcript_4110/m.9795 type:complete len:215 (+) Transcript_4110:1208-1852(+)
MHVLATRRVTRHNNPFQPWETKFFRKGPTQRSCFVLFLFRTNQELQQSIHDSIATNSGLVLFIIVVIFIILYAVARIPIAVCCISTVCIRGIGSIPPRMTERNIATALQPIQRIVVTISILVIDIGYKFGCNDQHFFIDSFVGFRDCCRGGNARAQIIVGVATRSVYNHYYCFHRIKLFHSIGAVIRRKDRSHAGVIDRMESIDWKFLQLIGFR